MDQFDIKILDDGTIKSSSGKVSAVNHQNAEAFLKMIAQLTGGKTTITPRGEHAHHHAHGEVHHEH